MSVVANRIIDLPLRDDLEADVDEAIRQAGGERQTIRGLILGQREITAQLGSAISKGYVRLRVQ